MKLSELKSMHIESRKAGEQGKPRKAVLERIIGHVETTLKNRPGGDEELIVAQSAEQQVNMLNEEIGQRKSQGREVSSHEAELAIAKQLDDQLGAERRALEAEKAARQLSPEALETAIKGLIESGASNIGAVMKGLKEQHEGNYDGKIASEITRKLFSK